jgi:hypothetical protein
MSPPSTESAAFEISTASREAPQPAVETRSEFRYENRRPRAGSLPTCLNTPTSNHTTRLPRSRHKTCMVWKLKTTTAPSRELSNDQLQGLFARTRRARETSPTAVETCSEFRYENRRPRADSQPTCLNALTSNHTTLLPRSRQKTCMVWKLKTTTAPSRGLSNDQAPGLVFPNPTSPRGPTTRRRNSFRVPLQNRRPRANSLPTCLNALTSNHTTLLPRSRQKTCRVWKLKTTTAPSRELSNDQAPGLVCPNPTSPRGLTTHRRNSFRVPLRKSTPPYRFTAHLPKCPHLKPYNSTSAIASENL